LESAHRDNYYSLAKGGRLRHIAVNQIKVVAFHGRDAVHVLDIPDVVD
jgi:hypothetical protein